MKVEFINNWLMKNNDDQLWRNLEDSDPATWITI